MGFWDFFAANKVASAEASIDNDTSIGRLDGIEKGADFSPLSGPFGSSFLANSITTTRPPLRGSRQLLQAYSQIPRLRAIVDKVSGCVAAAQWSAFRTNTTPGMRDRTLSRIAGEIPEGRRKLVSQMENGQQLTRLESHPALELLRNPNPQMTAHQFRQLCQQYVDLNGECFMIVERGAGGLPAELWPVPSHWVTRLPESKRPSYEVQWQGNIREIASEDVLWIKHINPIDPYGRGVGVCMSLSDELDADEYAAQTIAHRFFNKATPELLITLTGARQEEIETLKRAWDQQLRGWKRTGRPHFINKDFKVEKLDVSFADLQLVELRRFEAEIIRETFGVPPEIMGHVDNSNRATIQSAYFLFAINTLVPRLDFMADFFNQQLVPLFGADDSLILHYESPVPADMDFMLDILRAAPWAMTIDETRELVSKAPLEEGGDRHMLGPETPEHLDTSKVEEEEEIEEDPDPEDFFEEEEDEERAGNLQVLK